MRLVLTWPNITTAVNGLSREIFALTRPRHIVSSNSKDHSI